MYARTVTAIYKPGKLEDAIELWKRHVAPAFKYFKGCQTGYLFTNPATRQYLSLSFWKTQDEAEAVQTSGTYTKLLQCFQDVFEKTPIVTIYRAAREYPSPSGDMGVSRVEPLCLSFGNRRVNISRALCSLNQTSYSS